MGLLHSHTKAEGVFCRVLCGVFLMGTSVAFGQSEETPQVSERDVLTIRPGDAAVDGNRLPSHTASWRVTRVSPEGEATEVGVWTDTWKVVEREGERFQRFETVVARIDQALRRDVKYKRLPTLETASVELFNYNGKGGWAYFHYEGGRATGVFRREAHEETLSEAEDLGELIFEAGSEVELFLFYEPRAGFALRYPTHHLTNGGIVWVTAEVQGKEVIETGPSGATEAWRIENSLGWTYWLVRQPPYVLRLETLGTDGTVTRWALIDHRPVLDD